MAMQADAKEQRVDAGKAPEHPRQPGGPAPDETPQAPAPPPAEEVEMGGEAPCQLPRFWDVEE